MVSIVSYTSANGQTPGSWTKVKIGQYEPIDFAFADSLHGILLCNRLKSLSGNLVCFATSDGGKSWELTSVSPRADVIFDYYWTLNGFQSPKPGFGSIALDEFADELTIQSDTFVYYPTTKTYPLRTSAEKMYSPEEGCRFVCKYDTNGNLVNESFLRVTHDGWRSFDSAGRFLDAVALDATILDSDNIWAPAYTKIFHYYGGSWHTLYPEDISHYTGWAHIECGMTRAEGKDEVYALGVGVDSKTDFDYSDNGGTTWERHSKFGRRIYSLAATSPGTVWCFVGNAPPTGFWDLYSELKLSHHFADTIYYSTDHGNSWLEDSTTFSGAAMMQMHWVDPRHGFVSTLEFADTCFMYRYEAPGAAGVRVPQANEPRLRILTSPVLQQLSFSSSNAEGPSTVRVFDLLGRTRVLEHRANSSAQAIHVDVQTLPPGYYVLSFSDKVGTSTQGFIKQ